jgi:hypothetical protein
MARCSGGTLPLALAEAPAIIVPAMCVRHHTGAKHDEGADAEGSDDQIDAAHEAAPHPRGFGGTHLLAGTRGGQSRCLSPPARVRGGRNVRETRAQANLHTSLRSTMPAATQARHAAITRAQNKRSSWFSLRSRLGFMQLERRFVHLIPGRRCAHSFHTPAPLWPAPGGGATGSRWLSACRNAVRISSARTGLKSSRPIRSALAACE